jgi:hypothetical protein
LFPDDSSVTYVERTLEQPERSTAKQSKAKQSKAIFLGKKKKKKKKKKKDDEESIEENSVLFPYTLFPL